MYWQRVSAATVVRTGKNYKLEVPRSQTVAKADAQWRDIASGLEQRAVSRFAYSLLSVPPTVRNLLENRGASEQADAALLAMHLSEGRENALGTVRSLLAVSPVWITRNGGWAWRAIAAYAADHGLAGEAAAAFRRSAAETVDEARRSRDLVSAALLMQHRDPAEVLSIMAQVDTLANPDKVHVAIARTVLSREPSDGRPWALDPLLTRSLPEVGESVAAQRLLAMQARRSGDLDAAVQYGRNAVRLDGMSDESKRQLAESLLARWNEAGSSSADLREGTSLLRAFIDQQRSWSGPTSEAVELLARAYGLSGQYEALLKLALPPPFGAAELGELNPATVRMAAHAASSLGRPDAVASACALLGDEPADQLTRAGVGMLELSGLDLTAVRLQVFEKALSEGEHEEAARHAVALAVEGVDVGDRLEDLMQRGLIPGRVVALSTAISAAREDLEAALPVLRELAKTDSSAAEYLIGVLREADRHQDAAEAAASLFEITGSESYLIDRADCLIDAGGGPTAERAAEAAIAVSSIRPVARGRLLTFLGASAADREDWPMAERYLAQVLELFDSPSDSAVWRLVVAMVNQGRVRKAAKVIAQHHPAVRSREDAELWLGAHSALRWNERIALDAYTLAERFNDDPQLSTALLGHIVANTHGVDDGGHESFSDESEIEELDSAELEQRRALAQGTVPGELHRRAFELMGKLVERHGDSTGIKVITGAGDEDLLKQVAETLKSASHEDGVLAGLVEQVRACEVPLGFLAGILGRGYATLVIQRALGVLVAGSPNDAEHEIETAAARDVFNREIVVDAAAVVTLAGLRDPSRLTGRYSAVVTPPAAMLGLHRAAFDIRGLAGSPGSIRWDSERDGIVINELSAEEFKRLYERSERVQEYADRIQVRSVTERTALAELADDRKHAEWVDVLELALEHRLPLWSDDLGLRRLARALGLTAFGTPSVVDAIRDQAIESATDGVMIDEAIASAFDAQVELAADLVVDLALGTEGLLRVAKADDWNARAGAFVLTRPAWWLANADGVSALRTIYKTAREVAPDSLPAWQLAAMYGVARALQPKPASMVLALLAMLGYDEDDPGDEVRLDGLRRARRTAADLGLPDPVGALPAAAVALARAGKSLDPEKLVTRILKAIDHPEG